uniref:VWFA domain-containing protein n=1 Tax=Neogobius melanostomus TaxID=47308 RepID=A0A8C6TA85_9GOBI
MGKQNFEHVRNFLISAIRALHQVGGDKFRFALVRYNSRPKTEFKLNTYPSPQGALSHIRAMSYDGGGTRTGFGLDFLIRAHMNSASGSRAADGVTQMVVVLTDGRSQDDVTEPAHVLHLAEVEVFAVGVQDALDSELRDLASKPYNTHVFSVESFLSLKDIVQDLVVGLCGAVAQNRYASVVSEDPVTGGGTGKMGRVTLFSFLSALVVGPRDIIFLLDSTMGGTLFNASREFIRRYVNTLPIDPSTVQVGVAQFSTDARVEIDLNTHGSRDALAAALGRLRLRTGQQTVNIGAALDFVRTNMLTPDKGSRFRQGVPQLVLLMTSKRSSDSVDEAARALQEMGVLTVAVGTKAASEDELKRIAFTESVVHMLKDFRMLLRKPTIVTDGLSTLSGTVVIEEPTETGNSLVLFY